MTELSPSARALLDAARAGLAPSVAETSRGRARLVAAVAVPAVIAAAPAPASGTSAVVKAGVIAGGVTAMVIAGVLAIGGGGSREPAPPPAPAPAPPPAPVITPLPQPEPEPEPEPLPVPDPQPVPQPDPQPQRQPRPKPTSARPERAPEGGESKDDSLAREVRHLATARAALRAGDPAAAGAALAAYRDEFGTAGQLAAEATKLEKENPDAP